MDRGGGGAVRQRDQGEEDPADDRDRPRRRDTASTRTRSTARSPTRASSSRSSSPGPTRPSARPAGARSASWPAARWEGSERCKFAFKHPELFSAVVVHSPAILPESPADVSARGQRVMGVPRAERRPRGSLRRPDRPRGLEGGEPPVARRDGEARARRSTSTSTAESRTATGSTTPAARIDEVLTKREDPARVRDPPGRPRMGFRALGVPSLARIPRQAPEGAIRQNRIPKTSRRLTPRREVIAGRSSDLESIRHREEPLAPRHRHGEPASSVEVLCAARLGDQGAVPRVLQGHLPGQGRGRSTGRRRS